MDNMNLIPNKSLGDFVLGSKIEKHVYLPHEENHQNEKYFSYDSYDFYEINLVVWVEEKKIVSLLCEQECYWQGKNIIKMPFEEFLISFKLEKPNKKDSIYLMGNKKNGQNQDVYYFDGYGLQIWVWRKKIVTVIVSNERLVVEDAILDLIKGILPKWLSKFAGNGILIKTPKIRRKDKEDVYQSFLELRFEKDKKILAKQSYTIYDNYKQLLDEDTFPEFINKEIETIFRTL